MFLKRGFKHNKEERELSTILRQFQDKKEKWVKR